jgi:hemin uptake protein HemP
MYAPSRTAATSNEAFTVERGSGDLRRAAAEPAQPEVDSRRLLQGQREAAAEPAQPEVDSRRLLQGQREVVIRHGGECYRLRHTRNDKLILTK